MSTTRSGKAITDELVDEVVDKAEKGFDVDDILRHLGGRPTSMRAPSQESAKPSSYRRRGSVQ